MSGRGGGMPRHRVSVAALLIAVNVTVFVAMITHGVPAGHPGVGDLYRWGALEREAVVGGEWWRLVTAMFLHYGLLHIAMNMYSLWAVGPFVEEIFGPWPFTVLYVLSGLFAGLTSLMANPLGVGAGASGAICGVVGGLIAFLLRFGRSTFGPDVVRAMMRNIVMVIALNVFIGVSTPGIDNAAHGGGLVSGAALGWLLASGPTRGARERRGRRALLVAAGGLAVVVVLCLRLARQ